jgi:hypothetical protein
MPASKTAIQATSSTLRQLDTNLGTQLFTPMAQSIDDYLTASDAAFQDDENLAITAALATQNASLMAAQAEITAIKADEAKLASDTP